MAINDLVKFLKEVRFELTKVQWPSFDEFAGSTLVVIVLVAFFALYLGGVDLAFAKLAQYIFGFTSGG